MVLALRGLRRVFTWRTCVLALWALPLAAVCVG